MRDLDALTRTLAELAGAAVVGEGVHVAIKTDYGPEFIAYDPRRPSRPAGPADWIKPRAAVIVRDDSGRELARYGGYPATNPLKVAAVVVPGLILAALLVRGVIK